MFAVFSRVFVALTLTHTVLAASTSCVVNDLRAIQKKTELLSCTVSDFKHRGNGCLTSFHDLKPLIHIYYTSCELDALLENTIDDVQTSCDFSDQDSQTVLLALSEVQQPLVDTLNAFSEKACDLTRALGPHLTHKLVSSSLLHTRHLTLNLLRSVTFKVESQYRSVLKNVAQEINKQFTDVIRKYNDII